MKSGILKGEGSKHAGEPKIVPNLKLRQAREARLYSQAKLAEKVGVSARTIARWEQGEVSPFGYNIRLLCQHLDMSAEELGFEASVEGDNWEELKDQSFSVPLVDEPELQDNTWREKISEEAKLPQKRLSRRKLLVGIALAVPLLGGAGYASVLLRRALEKKQIHRFYYKSRVTSLAWSPTEDAYLASAHEDHTVQIWNLTTEDPSFYNHHTSGWVSDVVWAPRGDLLASVSGGNDPTLRIWKFPLEKEDRFVLPYHDRLTTVAWSPDGKSLALASRSQAVEILSSSTLAKIDTYTVNGEKGIQKVRWSPDSVYVATGTTDGALHLRNTLTRTDIYFREEHTGIVEDVAWSPNGQWLASASADGTVKVWDAMSGRVVRTYRGHGAKVSSVAWSPYGQTLASASADKTVQLWNPSTGKMLTRYPEIPNGELNAVCWSPDGKSVAFAGEKLEIEIWAVPS